MTCKVFKLSFFFFLNQGYAPPPKNGVEQKRPGRPLNITSLVRLSSAVPNQISVTWAPEIGKVNFPSALVLFSSCPRRPYHSPNAPAVIFQTYSMSVYLVRQLTSPLLLQRLRMKGIRNPDHSRALSEHRFFCWKSSAVFVFRE